MTRRNKFGIDLSADVDQAAALRDRKPGPMGVAIRDTADNLQAATEEKVEQRRKNAADAKEYREARDEGRVLISLPVDAVRTDDLPRDRLDLSAVALSDEMDELKTSIRDRGQREPIEVYRDEKGAFQLKSGWRRLNALRQLAEEAGDGAFSTVTARVAESGEDRLTQYLDMVEENIIREDLSFAEMAQLAITAAADPAFEATDAEAMIGRLYKSVHKVKRSYIRSFVLLLNTLGDALKWPRAIPRNLGVEAARNIKSNPQVADRMRDAVAFASDAEDQNRILQDFVAGSVGKRDVKAARKPKEKFEFHIDGLKITARRGECRIVGDADYTEVPKARLEKAILAFKAVLEE